MDDVLQIRGLHKTFGGPGVWRRARGRARLVRANAGIDLDVAAGQVVGLLGHNGAGKSTLVNQVVGLSRPDAGSIRVVGVDAVARPALARRLVSVQAQANVPITGLTPRTAIELVGRMRGISAGEAGVRADRLIDALDIGDWAATPAQKVSGGIARLTAFAMTAVAPGRLVVLDEPTNDVDPVRRRLLWEQIRRVADEGSGVLLVTHNVREAERVVDDLVILDHGLVVAADSPGALTQSWSGRLTLEVDLVPGVDPGWPDGAAPITHGVARATLVVASGDAPGIVEWASRRMTEGRIERYALSPASLEDVYIGIVSHVEEVAA